MKRLLPLVMILVLAPLLAGCADVDRSLYSLSDAIAPQDRVTGQRSLSLSSRQSQIQQSNQQGSQLIQQAYLDKGKPINEKVDAAQYARLVKIFDRVHAVSHLADENWSVYLLPDDTFNAFVMGGTQMFVFNGLMKQVKNDDELAAVIGHEISHVAANHVYEQQSYTMAARIQGSKSAGRSSFQSAFTLKNEEEADRIGILYATLAGYDPYAASKLWKRMYDNQGDFSAVIIDHPINSERAGTAAQLAAQYKQFYMPGQINPQHADILRAVFGGANENAAQTAGSGGGLMSVLEATAVTLGKKQQAKAEEAQQKKDLQFLAYVNQSLKGESLQLTSKNSLRAVLVYTGQYAVQNLNLGAIAGKEMANAHMQGAIKPGTRFAADFTFEKTDLTTINPSTIRVQAVHAEGM